MTAIPTINIDLSYKIIFVLCLLYTYASEICYKDPNFEHEPELQKP